ncbi:MAG: DUF3352 domain-containing protein [Anaerolineae bacterium]
MKRMMLVLFVMLLALAAPIQAQDTARQDGVPQMARYYSDDTFMFAAMRIDGAYIDQLSTLLNRVTSTFADLGVPQVDLRGLLSMVSGGSDVFAWLGDYAAFGYSGDPALLLDPTAMSGTSPSGIPDGITAYGVIELRDAAAAEDFLASILPSSAHQTPVDGEYPSFMTADGTSIVITPTAAYVLPPGIPFLDTRVDAAPTFDANTTFTTVTGHLPAPGYNALIYADANIFAQAIQLFTMSSSSIYDAFKPASAPQDQAQMAVPSIPVAIGLTILNNDTLTIDVATLAGGTASQAINPDFVRFLPANAGAVVQATNLTGLYDTAMTLAASSAGSSNSASPDQQVEAALQAIGLDLREDVLSWTTGDYALFARADLVEIARGVNANKLDVNGLYDFGLIMEATDPALAIAFTNHINTMLTQAVMADTTSEDIRIDQQTFGTTEATVYELHIPSESFFGPTTQAEDIVLPIAVGANDDIFFVATAAAAEAMFAGGDSLMETSAYQDATTYFLPNPTSVWYTSGDGFLLGMGGNPITAITLLALTGPAIGNVFDSIVMELSGMPVPLPTATPTPTPVPTMTAAQLDQEVAPIIALNNLIRSSTISSTTTDDGATLVRMTISLNIGDE